MLAAIKNQTYLRIELIIVDNCSSDGTIDYLNKELSSARIIYNNANVGYCKGHNQAISFGQGEYLLILNPDALITPTFIEEMVRAIRLDNKVGIVAGKLLRIGESFDVDEIYPVPTIDSTGLIWKPNGRFFDRGAGDKDKGQYESMEYIFGACGAALFLRRSMLNDIAFEGQYFDEDFYFGQEDSDLSWRAQIAGWKAIYNPKAVAYHFRLVKPDYYARMPRWQRIHSMKNRFMIRIKNLSVLQFIKQAIYIISWDIVLMTYTLLYQPYALKGLYHLAVLMPRNVRKRRFINRSRRVLDKDICQWSSWKDISKPIHKTNREINGPKAN